MSAQDSRIQQMFKLRRTTLGFGVVQILLGISLTALSFTAFAFTSSDRIRNACPYWAGFTVFFSGGLGIIAWKHSSVMSMSLFTFFSAVCVVLQMIGTILTGDAGGLLKSLIMCEKQISGQICKCCDSIAACTHSAGGFEFEGVNDCSILTGLLTGLMYGLCVLTIFGSLLCFIATILGCTAVARETSRNQGLCSRHSSRRSHTSNQDRYTWSSYPTDLSTLPSYAPPVYHSVENFQDYGLSSCIVPPPVFDPTDLPPPYSSQNPSLAESQYSLSSPETSTSQVQECPAGQDLTGVHTSLQSAINQVHFPAGWELTQVHTSVRSAIHDEPSTVQSDQTGTTCSTPGGVIHFEGGDPTWDEQSSSVSQGSELFLPSDTSCLSSDCTDEASPDRELCRAEIIDLNSHETVNGKRETVVVPLKAQHSSFSVTRLQAEFCELVPDVVVSKKRSSSLLGSTQNGASDAQVNIPPGATVSSPLRSATVLSLRTRCSSLGENSIYVNSFEVLARPPPNVRIPPDEPGKPFTSDGYFNTRNAKQRLRKGAADDDDNFIEAHGNGRSEQRKERSRHRRRRHPCNVPKHKEKRNASSELPTSEVNSAHAHEDPVSPGKETIV